MVSRRWEVAIALAIGIATISSAVAVYAAVRKESSASAEDQKSVTESVLLQQQYSRTMADTEAAAGVAARYRRMLAEAEAYEQSSPQRAQLNRAIAHNFIFQASLADYIRGSAAGDERSSDKFAYDAYRQVLLHLYDQEGLTADQADQTALQADIDRASGRQLSLGSVGMLAVVVVLTVARNAGRRRRIAHFTAAAFLYLAAAVWSILALI